MVFGRVAEQLGAADGNFRDARDELGFGPGGRRENFILPHPARADGERGAAGDLRKLSARNFMLRRLADREVGFPMGLVRHG